MKITKVNIPESEAKKYGLKHIKMGKLNKGESKRVCHQKNENKVGDMQQGSEKNLVES